jgi:hypothetical protein
MKQKECLLAALLLLPLTAMAALEASDLRVESLRFPLGIDTQRHRQCHLWYDRDTGHHGFGRLRPHAR